MNSVVSAVKKTVSVFTAAIGIVLSPQAAVAGAGCKADLANEFLSVVRVAVSPAGTCTGIVVNPYQIITAGHCLVNDGVKISPNQLKIHVSTIGGHVELEAHAIHVHEKFEKYGKFDIAVVDLIEPAPAFSKIARNSITQGDPVSIGGYGVQSISGYGPSSTVRNMGENRVEFVDEDFLILRPVTIPRDAKALPKGSPCIIFFGDSGGGVLSGNKVYAIQMIGTRIWEKDGTIVHQDRVLRLDAPGIKEFLGDHLDASSW